MRLFEPPKKKSRDLLESRLRGLKFSTLSDQSTRKLHRRRHSNRIGSGEPEKRSG